MIEYRHLNRIKATYAALDRQWSWSVLVFAWAGAVYGAVNRFDAWSVFLHQDDLWRITEVPIAHFPFKWEWCGPAAKIVGVAPAFVLLVKQTTAWQRSPGTGRPILVNVGIMVFSALMMEALAFSRDGLAFGFAAAACIAVAGQALKTRMTIGRPTEAIQK